MAERSHRIRKIDRCLFLDTALLFLFAIAEINIQKTDPQFIAPHIQELYDFSKSLTRNRSPAFLKTLRILGFSDKAPKFQTCLSVVLEAIFVYTRFLEVSAENNEEIQESALNAVKYYLSRYFPAHSERVSVCNYCFLRRMKLIQTTYTPFSFTEETSGDYLKGMKSYFRSSEFKNWWNLFETGSSQVPNA